jgi:hypothetical protein
MAVVSDRWLRGPIQEKELQATLLVISVFLHIYIYH